MSLLERYNNGEHAEVTQILRENRTENRDAALEVSAEIARRIRANIETLKTRWETSGVAFDEKVLGERNSALSNIQILEAGLEHRIPELLRALYIEMDFIDMYCSIPDKWRLKSKADMLMICPVPDYSNAEAVKVQINNEETFAIDLFTDPITKEGYSGVGPFYVDLSMETPQTNPGQMFDCDIYFEGYSFGSLLEYLRKTILENGALFGSFTKFPASRDELGCTAETISDVKEFTAGLTAF